MKKTRCFPVISVWPFSSFLDVPMASEKARLAASLATEWVVPGVLSSEAHLEIKKGSSQGCTRALGGSPCFHREGSILVG